MLNSAEAGNVVANSLLDPVSATSTAGATTASGNWVDSEVFEGYLIAVQQVGVVTGTGSLTGAINTSAANTGATPAAVAVGGFAAVTASSSIQSVVIPKTALTNRYVGYVGTIAGITGALVGVSLLAAKKYA
jgi:hypothetical protein